MTQGTPASLDLLDPRLRPLCDAYLQAAGVPGASIAVVSADRGYHYAYGVKAMASGEPVTADTSFSIASGAKAFVSAAVASLVADGLVAWDDPVSRHVPELQLYDPWITEHVTLRDLSANRLGLPRVGLTESGIDPSLPAAYVFRNLRHTAPIHPFRDRFTYVTFAHVANAEIVARVTGKSFLEALRERILEPLGMTGTSVGEVALCELSDVAAFHCPSDRGVVQIDTVVTDQRIGSSGVIVSGRDALQWLRLHLNAGVVDGRQVIARDALQETHTPQVVARPGKDILSLFYPGAHMAAYALGWAVSDLDGHPLVCHSGVDYGSASMTLMLPRSGIGVAVYGNLQQRGPVPLAYAIASTLLNLPPRDWSAYFESFAPTREARPPSVEPIAMPDARRYTGCYSHPADGPLFIEDAGDGLTGRMERGYRMTFHLKPLGEDRFALAFDHPEWQQRGALERPTLDFTVDDGRASSAELFIGPVGRAFLRNA